jgi:hypothetical protein
MLALGALKGDAILDIDLEARAPAHRRSALGDGGFGGTAPAGHAPCHADRGRTAGLVAEEGHLLSGQPHGRRARGEGTWRASASCRSSSVTPAPQKAGELFAMLALEPELQQRVTAAVLVGNRRWKPAPSDNGVDVKLPELAAEAAWGALCDARTAAPAARQGTSASSICGRDDKLIVRQAHPAVAEDAEGTKKKSDQTAPAGKAAPEEQPILTPAATPLSTSVRQEQRKPDGRGRQRS